MVSRMDRLDRCFSGSGREPPRLLKKEASIKAAEEHLRKAEGNLLAMETMFRNKHFDWTIVTSYYAMYHAALSALWLIGIDARSHECAILAFEMFYTKKGKVDAKYAEYIKRAKDLSEKYAETLEEARTLRVKASYQIGEISSSDAESALTRAKEFVATIRGTIFEAKGSTYLRI